MTVIDSEMISPDITLHDVLPLSFLKKSAYTGSKGGMRYRMEKAEVPEESPAEKTAGNPPEGPSGNAAETEAETPLKTVLLISIWQEPFAYAETDAEKIEKKQFPFSKEGIEQSILWLNEQMPRFSKQKGIETNRS